MAPFGAHRRRNDLGSFMIELALVIGVLIFCIGIIVEYGRGYREYATIAEAARIAARNIGGYQGPLPIEEAVPVQARAALASLGANPDLYTITYSRIDINDSDPRHVYRALSPLSRFRQLAPSRVSNEAVYAALVTIQRLNPERGSFLTSLAFPKTARALFYMER